MLPAKSERSGDRSAQVIDTEKRVSPRFAQKIVIIQTEDTLR